MDDQLDNDLKDHIKEVFDNFDDHSSDEGWLKLREKWPGERSNRRAVAWLWWGGAAAILLLFLGIGIWIRNGQNQPVKISHIKVLHFHEKKTGPGIVRNDTAGKATPVKSENLAQSSTNSTRPAGQKASNTLNAINKTIPARTGNPTGPPINNVVKTGSNSLTSTPVQNNYPQPGQDKKVLLNNAPVPNTYASKTTIDSAGAARNKIQSPQMATAPKPVNATPSVAVISQPPPKTIESMFAEDQNKKTLTKPKNTVSEGAKVRFGIYAATYFNYAKGSDNQINGGAGFSSDIRITKNLRLVTGILIGQNKLNYADNAPQNIVQTNLVTAATLSKPTTFATAYFPGANNSSTITTFKGLNATLVELDIPVNLKYEFNPERTDAYISAGLSSGTFINEAYTYQYNTSSYFSPSVQQSQGQTTNKSFDSFYFAKTLNVAFGIGYPLGRNRLVIEPFLKYPLEGLGAQQIRFGAGGINLKFNFQSLKK